MYNVRVKLHNTTFNNVLQAKIENNTLIMSQRTSMEGVKEVRIPDVKEEEVKFINKEQ